MPLKRHSPLRPSARPLRRRSPMRRLPARRLRRQGSDPAYLEAVRGLGCSAYWGVRQRPSDQYTVHTRCEGPIHAHHAGKRPGVGLKAPDDTAIGLCASHHRDWHQGRGPFEEMNKAERRAWSDARILETQAAVSARSAAA